MFLKIFYFGICPGSAESLNATWNSTTVTTKPLSHDRLYYFLPYWDEKPTMYIRTSFPDHRRRMYQANVISRVANKLVCVQTINQLTKVFLCHFYIQLQLC